MIYEVTFRNGSKTYFHSNERDMDQASIARRIGFMQKNNSISAAIKLEFITEPTITRHLLRRVNPMACLIIVDNETVHERKIIDPNMDTIVVGRGSVEGCIRALRDARIFNGFVQGEKQWTSVSDILDLPGPKRGTKK